MALFFCFIVYLIISLGDQPTEHWDGAVFCGSATFWVYLLLRLPKAKQKGNWIMSKKHQFKISSKSTRNSANKSWRADAKESLNTSTKVNSLKSLEKLARKDRATRNIALKNKRLNQLSESESNTLPAYSTEWDDPEKERAIVRASTPASRSPVKIDRERATPANTEPGNRVYWASRLHKPKRRFKLTIARLVRWLPDDDALIAIGADSHPEEKRALSYALFLLRGDEV